MRGRITLAEGILWNVLRAGILIGVLCCSGKCLLAANCGVVKHSPTSAADSALLAANYGKAANLYRAELANHPGDVELTAGLVHALLRAQKVQEAEDAVKASLSTTPNSGALISLRGEVEYRQGTPWIASQTAVEAGKLDPCNPRNHMLLADLERMASLYATSRNEIVLAHRLDPADPEVGGKWIETLQGKERIAELEAYLSSPTGDDEEVTRRRKMYLEHLKKVATEPHKACRLVSPTTTAEIPLAVIMRDMTHERTLGLDVKLNGHTSQVQIDTGASGLLVTRSVADRARLKPFSHAESSGIGDQGNIHDYSAYADSIRVGNLEFQDCQVRVLDSERALPSVDGLIGMDVFSQFLVTLDYPVRKLLLGPLPPRPGESLAEPTTLKMGDSERDDSDEPNDPTGLNKPFAGGTGSGDPATAAEIKDTAAAQNATGQRTTHGPYDRYIAPEMKSYTPVYRIGHLLILPAALNGEKLRLFILDTGVFATSISPQAAREVTKVHTDYRHRVMGINGDVKDVYSADEITFRFAQLSQKTSDVTSFDTSRISKGMGMEISGFLGANTLEQLTVHIDYRDGLVKFDYDPKRGHKF